MIPYADGVVAWANGGANQALVTGAPTPVAKAAPGPVRAPGSGRTRKSGGGPKTAPPGPAPGSGPSKKPPAPAMVVPSDAAIQVSDAAISVDETILESEEDYGTLDHLETVVADDEATSIGHAPAARDSFGGQTDPLPNPTGSIRPPGNRNDDW